MCLGKAVGGASAESGAGFRRLGNVSGPGSSHKDYTPTQDAGKQLAAATDNGGCTFHFILLLFLDTASGLN
jgi:hypothetical protein